MKPENLKFLSDQIFYAGFGREVETRLKTAMNKGKEDIAINIKQSFKSATGEKEASYTLNLKKGNDDMYFFNSYDVSVDGNKTRMFLNKGEKSITAKEAFNLLEGRSVYKQMKNQEGVEYNAWLLLKPESFTEKNAKFHLYNDKYGFDLNKSMELIRGNGFYFSFDKEKTMKSLEKGNFVEIHNADKSQVFSVAANPKDRSLDVFNSTGESIKLDNLAGKEVKDKNEKVGMSI